MSQGVTQTLVLWWQTGQAHRLIGGGGQEMNKYVNQEMSG